MNNLNKVAIKFETLYVAKILAFFVNQCDNH